MAYSRKEYLTHHGDYVGIGGSIPSHPTMRYKKQKQSLSAPRKVRMKFEEELHRTMTKIGFRGRLLGPFKVHYTLNGISVRFEGKYVPELTLHYKKTILEFDSIEEILENNIIKQEIRKQKLKTIMKGSDI